MALLTETKTNAQMDSEADSIIGGVKDTLDYPTSQLAAYLSNRFDRAERAKEDSGVKFKLLQDLRQYEGVYDDETNARLAKQGGTRIYDKITMSKCDTLESWVNYVLEGLSENHVWDIESTPKPELPPSKIEALKAQGSQMLQQQMEQAQQEGQALSPQDIEIAPHVKDYFRNLMADDYIKENLKDPLTNRQIAWYQLEQATQGDKMKQEYPSTPREAFEQAIEGTYFEKEMIACDKYNRIGIYPYDMNLPVYTAWDIGFSDYTCITFFQVENMEIRIIDYFEDCNKGMAFYLKHLRNLPYWGNFGGHYGPHDMENHDWSTGVTKRISAAQQGVEFITIPRCKDKHDEIENARRQFPFIHFNAPLTEKLRMHLSMYRRKWDANLGMWKDKPLHNENSHGADSFLILCRAIEWINSGGGGVSKIQEVVGQVAHDEYMW